MELDQGMFAIKLYELNQQYGQLQSRILLCQNADHIKILQEIRKVRDECIENELLLQRRVDSSRSIAVSRLAEAQMDYTKITENILLQVHNRLEDGMNPESEELESAVLYAEYAIDFATQAMRNALLASLSAIHLQLTEDELQEQMYEKRRYNNE